MSETADRLAQLRRLMGRDGIDALVVPSRDPHNSEYVPTPWQRRRWISGFTGSNGDVAVTMEEAGLWTDSRYFLQAERELSDSGIGLYRMGRPECPSLQAWVTSRLSKDQVLGLDPELVPAGQVVSWVRQVEHCDGHIRWLETNPIDQLWYDRPEFSADSIAIHPDRLSGETVRHKLARLRSAMRREGADGLVVAALDSVAWLCNIRGTDVAYNPLVISYALVEAGNACLFVDPAKVTPELERHLAPEIVIRPYDSFLSELGAKTANGRVLWMDPTTASQRIAMAAGRDEQLLLKNNPITAMKAVKNKTEIAGFKTAQVRDGVAMVRFLNWLTTAVAKKAVTELSAVAELEGFRALDSSYRGPSFDTISGYGAHGAIVHYRVTEETDVRLEPKGLYLVDSGGQYPDGTTDITRTVTLGQPSTEQRQRFTLVLKGHIALLTSRFPEGTRGIQLDTLARQPLWERGLDYGHGTGHGIGSYLGVHEGPQSISASTGNVAALEPGMFISIEPGYYKEGAYGIRIENLAVVVDDTRPHDQVPFYRFESVTYCPIDRRLIETALLTAQERAYVDTYHDGVYRTLAPMLVEPEVSWLHAETRPL